MELEEAKRRSRIRAAILQVQEPLMQLGAPACSIDEEAEMQCGHQKLVHWEAGVWGCCALTKVAISNRGPIGAGAQGHGVVPNVVIGNTRSASTAVESGGAARMVESHGTVGGCGFSDHSGGIARRVLHIRRGPFIVDVGGRRSGLCSDAL